MGIFLGDFDDDLITPDDCCLLVCCFVLVFLFVCFLLSFFPLFWGWVGWVGGGGVADKEHIQAELQGVWGGGGVGWGVDVCMHACMWECVCLIVRHTVV